MSSKRRWLVAAVLGVALGLPPGEMGGGSTLVQAQSVSESVENDALAEAGRLNKLTANVY